MGIPDGTSVDEGWEVCQVPKLDYKMESLGHCGHARPGHCQLFRDAMNRLTAEAPTMNVDDVIWDMAISAGYGNRPISLCR